MRIALLHDHPDQADFICRVLSAEQYRCEILHDAKRLVTELQASSVDLLLVYWPALKGQGQEILRLVREKLSATMPILFIANSINEQDVFEGLAAGTVDYFITPIRAKELVTRIKTCLTLHYACDRSVSVKCYGLFQFDFAKKQIIFKDEKILVTAKEFELAHFLMKNLNLPLSRLTLVEQIWGDTVLEESRTLDTHMSRVRSKLRLRPENGYRLSTIYGYGYLLNFISSDV